MSAPNTQLIDVEVGGGPDASWQPAIGQETEDIITFFGTKLEPVEQERLRESTTRILNRCVAPVGTPATTTGLVVGYVQSGKTMSFTTVAAMAADNGYPLVIVITGTTKNLFEQSAERLESDLRLDSRGDRKWEHLQEPGPTKRERLDQLFSDWRDPNLPATERRIVLVTIKKNWSVLKRLIGLLESLNRDGIAALIIDDEADQASLNTRVQQEEESTTYTRLLQLRALFPRHTFLQYTATPQANLLINILDVLSPDFAELLEPGENYTGGIEFFCDQSPFIRMIPANETPTPQNPITSVPDSLVDAMRIFFVGVAAGRLSPTANRGNRTMLIHPSRTTDPQGDFAHWTRQVKQGWTDTFSLSENDPDRLDLLSDFKISYDELALTVGDLIPPWDSLKQGLQRAIRTTEVLEVNSTPRRATEIPWRNEYAWILVGGQALDRGFTIEGLTVTYMPRGLGMGNADTLQQRARFFGYKRAYLGYCRIYLDADVIDAFTDYVVHEENVRQQLEQFRATHLPLNMWKRAFLMAPGLQPTRRNVLTLDHLSDSFADQWFWVRQPQESEAISTANRQVFQSFMNAYPFSSLLPELFGQPATRHSGILAISLLHVYENLLVAIGVPSADDSQKYVGAMLQIRHFLQTNPDELCDVYFMNPGENSERAIDSTSKRIDQIFQGSNRQPGDPQYYPGDRLLHGDNRLTVQLRRLSLTEDDQIVATDVPVLAVWIPEKMGQNWLVQQPHTGS